MACQHGEVMSEQAAGGTVSAESAPGEGARLTVTLSTAP